MITDTEYPYRPAFSLLTKLLDENAGLLASLPNPSAAPSLSSASASAFGGNPSQAAAGGLSPAQKGKLEGTLASYLTKYQDPKQADTIMKVQQELDETKIVLVSATETTALAVVEGGTDSGEHYIARRQWRVSAVVERWLATALQQWRVSAVAKRRRVYQANSGRGLRAFYSLCGA